MIAWLVARTGLSPLVLKLAGVMLVLLAIIGANIAGEAKGTRNERARNTVTLLKAQAAIQKAEKAARDIADDAARAREQVNATQIEDLRHEAAKGNDQPVGAGVAGVLAKLREQQRPR